MAENETPRTRVRGETQVTQINGAPATRVSHNDDEPATKVRGNAGPGSALGAVLGGFTVTETMETASGEADLYKCTDGQRTCVAKIFRRRAAVKPEVVQQILKIDSPFVARYLASGYLDGYPWVILPYYKNGSLAGKRFGLKELKRLVIPSVNEGLKAMHSAGVFHKDLKPANMMLSDDMSRVVIIDFGVSTVARDGATSVATSTGLTTVYASLEALSDVYTDLSDYYSLGICLYELYCGQVPWKDIPEAEIPKYRLMSTVPFPDNMEQELKDLIGALLYQDISHRHEKQNPNCRWGYEQVAKWLKGIDQPLPGSGEADARTPGWKPYPFAGKTYGDMHSLVQAMAANWEEGKKQLYRGYLSRHFGDSGRPDLQTVCDDATESTADADAGFFDTLYRLDPDLKALYWKGSRYDSLRDLGLQLMSCLAAGETPAFFDDILRAGVLSSYLDCTGGSREKADLARDIEKLYTGSEQGSRNRTYSLWVLGYSLSGMKEFRLKDGRTVKDPAEVVDCLEKAFRKSYDDFFEVCLSLIDSNSRLEPSFEAWLVAMGKSRELDAWKRRVQK
ncbi:MAG: protein kinase [Abditibacteriota bacterium]|nr:protein kinase [Abditibacteriota bacterium]